MCRVSTAVSSSKNKCDSAYVKTHWRWSSSYLITCSIRFVPSAPFLCICISYPYFFRWDVIEKTVKMPHGNMYLRRNIGRWNNKKDTQNARECWDAIAWRSDGITRQKVSLMRHFYRLESVLEMHPAIVALSDFQNKWRSVFRLITFL